MNPPEYTTSDEYRHHNLCTDLVTTRHAPECACYMKPNLCTFLITVILSAAVVCTIYAVATDMAKGRGEVPIREPRHQTWALQANDSHKQIINPKTSRVRRSLLEPALGNAGSIKKAHITIKTRKIQCGDEERNNTTISAEGTTSHERRADCLEYHRWQARKSAPTKSTRKPTSTPSSRNVPRWNGNEPNPYTTIYPRLKSLRTSGTEKSENDEGESEIPETYARISRTTPIIKRSSLEE